MRYIAKTYYDISRGHLGQQGKHLWVGGLFLLDPRL